MALTSRLALEVDGRPAEQQIQAVRKALEGLTEAGLRAGPALSGAFANFASSAQGIKAASDSLRAVQKALEALNVAGAKTGQSLSGATGGLNSASAGAAAAEARVLAAKRALDALNEAASRAVNPLGGANNALNSAGRNAAGARNQVSALDQQFRGLTSSATSLLKPLLAAFGVTQSVQSIYQAAEAYSTLTNRMKLVTSTAEELTAAQSAVFGIAQSAYQPLTATAELYQRIATNQKELNLTSQELNGVVGTISKTLAISGASAASANAALIQLGQAFASGVLRGEELNSVMEQAPALAQAIARGMGKTVGELRALGAAGLLTAETVVKALQNQQQAVDDLFNKTAVTIGNSLTAFGNSFSQFVGKLDQASGASQAISDRIVGVSKAIDSLTADSNSLASTINVLGAAMGGTAAAAAVLLANKIGTAIYAWRAGRVAAIAQAEATLNAANADAIKTRTAVAAAQADMVLYRGTILQTVASGRYAEARLLQAQADERARIAAAGLATAQGGLLAAMGGPLGLALLVGSVAAAYLLMSDSSDQATKSLIDQGVAVDEATKKFRELSAEQQRLQKITWSEQLTKETEKAGAALDAYSYKVKNSFSSGEFTRSFQAMIAEVRAGQRSLDSVTEWIETNSNATPALTKELSTLAAEYAAGSKSAKDLSDKLAAVNSASSASAKSTSDLATAQGGISKQTKAQAAETEKLIAKMREEITLYGATEKVIASYQAKKLGMNAAQSKEIELLGSIQDVQKNYRDALKENDKARMESLRVELTALITQRNAAEDAAAKSVDAINKIHYASDKALGESVSRRIQELAKLSRFASQLPGNVNYLTGQGIDRPTVEGRGPFPVGAPVPPTVTPKTNRKSVADEVSTLLGQIKETTDPNKPKAEKAIQENAGQKLLDDARQRYAVLQQQSREIELQGGSTKALGAEAKKLIELEYEIANLKEKKTLTTSQKQVLAMAELNLAQQKQNAALEKANELTKERYENEEKLRAFRENLTSQNGLAREGLNNQLEGVGLGDKARQRMQEDLKIQQDYQKQQDKLNRDYRKIDNPTANDTSLYESETQALKDALAVRTADQQNYYLQEDAMRGQWLLGVNDSWQNYVDMATDYNQQAADATASVLADTTAGISDSIQGLIKGTMSLGDAFGNLASTMANSIIGALADIAAKWIVTHALQMAGIGAETTATVASEATKTTAKLTTDAVTTTSSLAATATTTSAQVAAAGTTLAAWLPAALVASIGSFGAAAVVGGTALIAAYALIKGFSNGGYTGAGGVNEPAGVVHKGEVVWSQKDIRNFGGVAAVESLRKGNVTPLASASGRGTSSGSTSGSAAQASGAPTAERPMTVNLIEDASKAGTVERSLTEEDVVNIYCANIYEHGKAHEANTHMYGLKAQGT